MSSTGATIQLVSRNSKNAAADPDCIPDIGSFSSSSPIRDEDDDEDAAGRAGA